MHRPCPSQRSVQISHQTLHAQTTLTCQSLSGPRSQRRLAALTTDKTWHIYCPTLHTLAHTTVASIESLLEGRQQLGASYTLSAPSAPAPRQGGDSTRGWDESLHRWYRLRQRQFVHGMSMPFSFLLELAPPIRVCWQSCGLSSPSKRN
jgi:hypothetical protein